MDLLLYGLQRSGTNYLEKLLCKTYGVKLLNDANNRASPNFKHVRLYEEKNLIPAPNYKNNIHVATYSDFRKLCKPAKYCIVLSKDPYSWYKSYKRWGKKCSWHRWAMDRKHHFIEEWNKYHEKWLQFSEETDQIVFVRYIDLLQDPIKEIERVGEYIGAERKENKFDGRLKSVPYSETFDKKRLAYYLEEKYMNEFSQDELEDLNDKLDLGVVEKLGYEVKDRHALVS